MRPQYRNNNRRPPREDKKHEVLPVERPVTVSLQTLLETGSHFGTDTASWNPKMTPYIYGIRNNVYVINLEKTLECWDTARDFISSTVEKGGDILFVGTKRQIKDVVTLEATGCNSYFVSDRWLGGTLTNLPVIRKTIDRLEKLEKLLASAEVNNDSFLNKKEKLGISREIEKLTERLGGLRKMKKLPSAIFITDPVKDHLAVEEALKMHVPIIALMDTDSNPELVDYPIPANDDGTSALALFVRAVADAITEAKALRVVKGQEEAQEAALVADEKFAIDDKPMETAQDNALAVEHKKKKRAGGGQPGDTRS